MTPWQILQAARAASAARDFYSQRGGGVSASAVAAAVGRCSSFHMSRGKLAMQELNGRLAWYLQQVHDLEASNQRLEIQIQRELEKTCPRELRHLDKHLRTVCLLQQKIHDNLAAKAELKLQLLNADLNISGLKLRCDHEDKQGRVVQEQLNHLCQQWEEFQVQLPQLYDHLNHLSEQMIEMQLRHQENTQYLKAQISGGITMDIRPGQSSALSQQLDYLRWTNDKMFTETLGNHTRCGNQVPDVQMSLMGPAVAFNHHEEPEFFQLELEQLRRTAMILEAELSQLEAQYEVLEASGMELENTLDQELQFLEEREDLLSHDLNLVLQASAQKAEDHHILVGVKNQLENEILDYRRLLEGLEQQWVPGFSSRFSNRFGIPTFPSTIAQNFTVKQMVSLPGRRIYVKEVQPLRGSFTTVNQTTVPSMFEPVVTKFQSIKIQDCEVSSNSRSLTDLDKNSENRPSVSVGSQPEDPKSLVVSVQGILSPDREEVLRKPSSNLSIADTSPNSEGTGTGSDGCLVQSHSITMRTSTQPNQAPKSVTRLSLYELSKQTVAETCNETATAEFPQQNGPEASTSTLEPDYDQIIHVTRKTEEAACETATSGTVKSCCVSVEAAKFVSGQEEPIDQTGVKNEGNTEGTTLPVSVPHQSEEMINVQTELQTFNIIKDSEKVLESKTVGIQKERGAVETDQIAELQTLCIPEQSGKLLTNQTELLSVNTFEPIECVLNGHPVQLQDVSVTEEIETVAHSLTAELRTVSVPDQTQEVTNDSTELMSVNGIKDSEKVLESQTVSITKEAGEVLSVQTKHLQAFGIAEESEMLVTDQTAEVQIRSVPKQSEEVLTNQTEVLTVNKIEPRESVLTDQSVQVTQSGADQSAGVIAVTVLCVSGTQPTVSVETTLADESQAENLVAEVKVQAVVLEGDQSSPTELNKALADKDKQAASAHTEALHYEEDVSDIRKCTTFSETLVQADSRDTKIHSVVTKEQLEEKIQTSSVPQLEKPDSTKEAQLEEESVAVMMDEASYPAAQGEFLSFESFQSLKRPRPCSNTLWMVLIDNSSEDVEDQVQEEKKELNVHETKISIRKVERHNTLKEEAEQSQSLCKSQRWSDRHATALVTEEYSTMLNGTSSSGQAGAESGQRLNGLLDGNSRNVLVQQEETLPPNGTSGGVFKGATGETNNVQYQALPPTVQLDPQEVSNVQANLKGNYGELSQVQTVSITEQSEEILTKQAVAELQTLCIPEQSEKLLTNQTELLSVNKFEPTECVLNGQPVQLQDVSVTEEIEKVAHSLTAELRTVSVPDQTQEVTNDSTELMSVNGIKDSEKVLESQTVSITKEAGEVLSVQTKHLQAFGIAKESEMLVTDQTAEVQPRSVPKQSEEVLTNQTEVLTVNKIEPRESVLTGQSVQLQVVSIAEETEKVLTTQTAGLQSVSSPEESGTAQTDQTELQTVTKADSEKALTDQPVQLQAVSVTEEAEKLARNQTLQAQNLGLREESKTVATDQTAEVQSVSRPEESEKALTDQSTSLDDTAKGSASSIGEKIVVFTAEVLVNDPKRTKLNEERATGPNLTASLSKDPSNDRIFARQTKEIRTVEKRKEELLNEMGTLIHRGAARIPRVETEPSEASTHNSRFSRENWIVYGGGVGRERSLNRTRSADSLSTVALRSQVRSGSMERKDPVVDTGSPQRSNDTKGGESVHRAENVESHPKGSQQISNLAGKAVRFNLEEWKVSGGGSPGHIRTWKSSDSLSKDEAVVVLTKIAVPAASVEARRLGSAASDEWRVYGGSKERISMWRSDKSLPKTVKEEVPKHRPFPEPLGDLGQTGVSGGENAGRVSNWVSSSIRPNANKEVLPAVSVENPPTSSPGSQGSGRLGNSNSGEWRVYGGSGRLSRSSSVDTGQASSAKLSTGSAGSSTMSSGSNRISTSGRYDSTGSVERKPVYSPASVRKNSAESGSKLSGQSGVRISNSSRPGTTSATGGRVIISSSRPIRSTGSGVGDNKERISVCKMAALSMAAAGRGRGQDQQKQEAASAPLLQQWLNSAGPQ